MGHLQWMLIGILSVLGFALSGSPPKFAAQYEVGGMLELPYAEIKEPFMAYYDEKAKSSRINYYNDMMQTYQLAGQGKFGTSKKIAFMSTDSKLNVRTCFQINGTVNSTVSMQAVLPDMTDFKFVGTENCPTEDTSVDMCQKWVSVNVVGSKKNTYTMWVQPFGQGVIPVRYQMYGYDSLFGSHYDKYYITYVNYFPGAVNPEKFHVDGNITCGGFPGPGLEAVHLHNPMNEFINNNQKHVDAAFEDFKTTHDKTYKNHKEHSERKVNFKNNFRYIHSMNRQKLTYTLAVNHLTDLTGLEMKTIRGKFRTTGYNGGLPFTDKVDVTDLPESLDWRIYGAVTPVKDQAVCGSCWSFGSTGVLEGAYFVKHGKRVKLSQQQLMDCSWGEGNNACDGGEDFRAYAYIKKNGGLESEETYGGYMGADGKCHHNKSLSVIQIKNFVNVTSGDQSALRVALINRGPISIGIDAALKSLSFYSSGVFYDPKCKSGLEDLDHAVLAVGYGVVDGQAYWLVKNSWSTYWGNAGYVLISQKDNNCGVATQPTFPVLV